MRKLRHDLIRPLLHLCFAILCAIGLFATVDLTPKIDENFFFSSDDPQLQELRDLDRMFKIPPQIILTAEGDIRSRPYLTRISSLTAELQSLEGVASVYSLGAGPSSVDAAAKSPLWSRLVIARDAEERERGSNFVLGLKQQDNYGELVENINGLKSRYDAVDFRLSVTGTPYLVHEIQEKLIDDMRNFTLAAVVAFAVVILAIYRSIWILFGAIVCAATSAFLDFMLLRLLGVDPGPLSANLWSIVFILTLSHVIFISGNWDRIARSGELGSTSPGHLVQAALRETGTASLWSMVTNSLGFLTLLFTAAKPIRQFGLSGLIGAILAMGVAYAVFPAYLRLARPPYLQQEGKITHLARRFISGRHLGVVAVLSILALLAVTGFNRINTQPSLLTYFQAGGQLREDLARIDRLGGVSPLYIAVSAADGQAFRTGETYRRLWNLQLALEQHQGVGEVISLPVLLGEIVNSPFASYLTWDLIYSILDLPALGEPGRGFVTEDRKTALFLLRMKETELGKQNRQQVVDSLLQIVGNQGFVARKTGGLFEQAGDLSTLVSKSLLQGVFGLTLMIFLIALIVSRSWPLSLSVICSLVLIPVTVLGAAGYLRLPLEIISTPGINLAMGLGVDEMIHLVHRARKGPREFDLENAKMMLWKPISASCLMLAIGFSVLSLSHFPPTRNMGWLVVIGSAMAWAVMLLVFPTVARAFLLTRHRDKSNPVRKAA